MSPDRAEPFADNWAYLRAELNWLDRLLSLAVAKQRQETKDLDRVSKSRLDRATSHWWKGLISLEGTASDSPADLPGRKANPTAASYQQQLDAKIVASEQQGIRLGLPLLCQRLQLTGFEKNLVLMALAPEVNRRYSKLYHCLQEPELGATADLPTVDLILRLLCRTDAEWRLARTSFTMNAPLRQFGLVAWPLIATEPLLTRPVKLADALVDYLLADQPDNRQLDSLLQMAAPNLAIAPEATSLQTWTMTAAHSQPASDPWAELILPEPILSELKYLCDRVQFATYVDVTWGFQPLHPRWQPAIGKIVLLIGAAGTGKTLVAQAIAQTLDVPLVHADLALLERREQLQLQQEIWQQPPIVLLLKSAQAWLGRCTPLPAAKIQRFLQQRQQTNSITLLCLEPGQVLKPQWQRWMQTTLTLPLPDVASRAQLWQRAFPAQVPLATIDWQTLAHQFPLTGGEICTIAREAAIAAAAEGSPINQDHLLQACQRSQRRHKR